MHGSFWCSVSKSFFDTLLQVFLHLKSTEKLMIESERHPFWVSFAAIFLPIAQHFQLHRQSHPAETESPPGVHNMLNRR